MTNTQPVEHDGTLYRRRSLPGLIATRLVLIGGGGSLGAWIADQSISRDDLVTSVAWGLVVGIAIGVAVHLLSRGRIDVRDSPAVRRVDQRPWRTGDAVRSAVGFALFVALGYAFGRFWGFSLDWFVGFATAQAADHALRERQLRRMERSRGRTVVEDADGDLVALPPEFPVPEARAPLA